MVTGGANDADASANGGAGARPRLGLGASLASIVHGRGGAGQVCNLPDHPIQVREVVRAASPAWRQQSLGCVGTGCRRSRSSRGLLCFSGSCLVAVFGGTCAGGIGSRRPPVARIHFSFLSLNNLHRCLDHLPAPPCPTREGKGLIAAARPLQHARPSSIEYSLLSFSPPPSFSLWRALLSWRCDSSGGSTRGRSVRRHRAMLSWTRVTHTSDVFSRFSPPCVLVSDGV